MISRSSSGGFSLSLTMTTRCVMRSTALPAEPMVMTTGLRRYLRASRSTACERALGSVEAVLPVHTVRLYPLLAISMPCK